MHFSLLRIYRQIVLERPVLTLAISAALLIVFGSFIGQFRLDASADSLVLENDENLRYYRSVNARYGTEDYVIITYKPYRALLSDEVLAEWVKLRDSLRKLTE